MKASLLLSLLFLLCVQSVFAIGTTGKIAGKVRDAKTGEALPSVNVIVEGTNYGAASNLDGYFVILNIPPGTYTVRASIVGYTPAVIREVRVEIDQTTDLDIRLNEAVIGTEEVVIVAARPIVQKDVSSSRANLSAREMENLPTVAVSTVVGLQAGISGSSIRGGGASETVYMINGLMLRDERNNVSYSPVSILAVQDIQVQTGGFNAEYGNVRSGVVNVITREGGKKSYNVGVLARYRPPGRKYFGAAPNERTSYWVRPFLDDAVAWTGTESKDANGNLIWDQWMQKQYPKFEGWNSISRKLLSDADPTNDLTPEAAQQLWLWQHRKEFDTGKPDWNYDVSLGGPVPVISEELGNLRFFGTYRKGYTSYVVPLALDGYWDESTNLKITSDISTSMKLMVEGLVSYSENVTAARDGSYSVFTSVGGVADALSNGPKFIDARMFSTDYWAPTKVNRDLFGAKFTHVLSPMTFYEVTLQRSTSTYNTNPTRLRDTSRVYTFGNGYSVDEAPFGAASYGPAWTLNGVDGMLMVFTNMRDSSELEQYNARADLVSQLDQYNQLKVGIEFNHTTNKVNYGSVDERLPDGNNEFRWTTRPIRFSAYAQDKLEFEGMVANVGLRYELSHAGGQWYRIDNPWTRAFSKTLAAGVDTLLQKEPTEVITTLSPRLGVAFPITENAKLFFNYGHFRSMPSPEDLYLVERDVFTQQILYVANPNQELPKTVAYELGYEHNLFDLFLMRVAAYYKDISNEQLSVRYTSKDGTVNYTTSLPNRYRDIRGFEFTLTKNRGSWLNGFINYTYQVTTSGYFGRPSYNEDRVVQRTNERENIYISRPVPQPYARLNLDFFSPVDFGPALFGDFYPVGDVRLNLLGAWSAGSYTTWVGGGSVPGVVNNLQWRNNWSFDLRASKSFNVMGANIQFFVDVYNVFNFKTLSSYGFVDATDRNDYFKSLHLPEQEFLKYGNIPGDDHPGDYRKPGATFQPMIRVNDITQVSNPDLRAWYFDVATRNYYQYNNTSGQFQQVDQAQVQKVLDDKAYIDMPNLDFFTFLNPRNWFFGVRVSFDIQ